MTTCTCLVQEGQIKPDQRTALEKGLDEISTTYFEEPADVSWTEVTSGHGWTGGESSTTSLVAMNIPEVPQDRRVELMTDICSLWIRETGCSINEIVANAINRPSP